MCFQLVSAIEPQWLLDAKQGRQPFGVGTSVAFALRTCQLNRFSLCKNFKDDFQIWGLLELLVKSF